MTREDVRHRLNIYRASAMHQAGDFSSEWLDHYAGMYYYLKHYIRICLTPMEEQILADTVRHINRWQPAKVSQSEKNFAREYGMSVPEKDLGRAVAFGRVAFSVFLSKLSQPEGIGQLARSLKIHMLFDQRASTLLSPQVVGEVMGLIEKGYHFDQIEERTGYELPRIIAAVALGEKAENPLIH